MSRPEADIEINESLEAVAAKLTAARMTIKDKDWELKQCMSRIASQEEEKNDQDRRVRELETELERYLRAQDDAELRLTKAKGEAHAKAAEVCDEMHSQISGLQTAHDEQVRQCNALREDLTVSEQARQAALKQVEEMREKLETAENSQDASRIEISDLTGQCTALREDLRASNQVRDSGSKHVEELREKLQTAEKLHSSARDEVSTLTGQLKQTEQHIQELQDELDATKLDCSIDQAESIAASKREQETRLECEALQKKFDVAEQARLVAELEVSQLGQTVKDEKAKAWLEMETRISSEQRMAELQSRLSESQSLLVSSTSAREQLEHQAREQQAAMNAQQQELVQRIEELAKQCRRADATRKQQEKPERQPRQRAPAPPRPDYLAAARAQYDFLAAARPLPPQSKVSSDGSLETESGSEYETDSDAETESESEGLNLKKPKQLLNSLGKMLANRGVLKNRNEA